MGRKITMAANPWKVVALGSLHAHPPRGHRVPAHAGRCDRPLAGGAAQATPSRRTRGGSVHLVLSRRPGPSGERDSGAPVPVLPAPLGEVDPRGSGARPDETLRSEVEVFTSSFQGAPDQVVSAIPVHRFRYFPRRWERLTHEEAAPDRMKRSDRRWKCSPRPFKAPRTKW